MDRFRIGLGNQILNSRYSPTALPRADYLTAVAAGLDAYWVGDHLNALFPRSIYKPEYVGVAKVAPKLTRISNRGPCSAISPPATGSHVCVWVSA